MQRLTQSKYIQHFLEYFPGQITDTGFIVKVGRLAVCSLTRFTASATKDAIHRKDKTEVTADLRHQ